MSIAPRPQIAPSRSTPANDSTDQSWLRAGTTSRWPRNASEGPSPRPGRRTIRFGRSGSLATHSDSRPASAATASITAAATASRPGGFEVSHATSRCSSCATSLRSAASSAIERRVLRLLNEPAGEPLHAFSLTDVSLPIRSVPGQEHPRALELLGRAELLGDRRETLEQRFDPLARRDRLPRLEVDE